MTTNDYSKDIFTKSIKYSKGVGPKYAEILSKKGIITLYDLIFFFPRTYEDRRKTLKLHEALENNDKTCVVYVEVIDISSFTFQYRNKPLVIVTDGIAVCEVPIYGGRLPAGVAKGAKLYLTGKFVRGSRGKLQCRMTEFEKPSSNALSYGKIVPIYPLTEGLSQKKLRTLIVDELVSFEKNMKYDIPSIIKKKYRLKSFVASVMEMHFPTSFEALSEAKESLIFEEFLTFQYIHLIERRPNILIKEKRYDSSNLLEKVKSSLTFELTPDQLSTIEEIKKDLFSEKQMFRLLQGDVGAGKTIVAFLTALIPAEAGFQTAFLAPTEILALQHYNNFKKIIKLAGLEDTIKVDILTASVSQSERGYLLKRLREGKSNILVGTHSIIYDEVVFKNLSYAIVDEQQRFGVAQRNKLLSKGNNVDYLLMTATPIPQSLALTLFGELDLSIIKSMPSSRKGVLTKYKELYERDHCYKFLKSRIAKGEQGYIVFPLIENNDSSFITLSSEFKRAKETYFSDIKIEIIHGKMKDEEKEYIMNRFANGEIKVLFSTTVIEVGIDNPNATTILIEGAERFGLSQLHQLRGRVGRGDKLGYCYLILHSELNDIIKERINIICETTDGFKISEKDLELRGSGEFLGDKQSGIPDFKLGNIIRDKEIMRKAKDEMRSLLKDEESKKLFYKENEAFILKANYLKERIVKDE
ncbi:ATP-dependent DNA helicase RecG [Brachyspira pulli]|uniref:ATP-dependent DNA helicase RecG n=1 Tax=Brachyspira pulli TaxID=310721 RepID=UPI0030050EB1